MSAINWLTLFLHSRDTENEQPDGRSLYAYRCVDTEFNELQQELRQMKERAAQTGFARKLPLGTPALFTLYCSEWWRREYAGGVWNWNDILESIGWRDVQRSIYIPLVEMGLKYWKTPLIRRNRNEYYLTVAVQGGIPINVLNSNQGAFNRYLKALMKSRARYIGSGLDMGQFAKEELKILPRLWQQPQIAELATLIINQVWSWSKEISDEQDAVQVLNRTRPGWQDRLPIVVEAHAAEVLIRALIQGARQPAKGKVIRLARFLENGLLGWQLRAQLTIPRSFNLEQLSTWSELPAEQLPERMELYRSIGQARVMIARLSKVQDQYHVRPLQGAIDLYVEGASAEVQTLLMRDTQMIATVPVVGGEELDTNIPWVFKQTDEDAQSFQFVTQGSCRSRELELSVLSLVEPTALQQEVSALAVHPLTDKRNLWQVKIRSEIQLQGDESYLIEPGLDQIAERDYCVVGNNRHFPSARNRLFASLPRFFKVDEDGRFERITEPQLRWRPIQERVWRRLPANNQSLQVWGDIKVCYLEGGYSMASWSLSVLPNEVSFHLDSYDRLHGSIRISGLPVEQIRVCRADGFEVEQEPTKNGCLLQCTRQNNDLTTIRGELRNLIGSRLEYSVPFPAHGAAFISSDEGELEIDAHLPFSRLYGVRAQSINPHEHIRYKMRVSLAPDGNEFHSQSINQYRQDIPLFRHGSGFAQLSIQQFQELFSRIFATSVGVDDRIKLEIVEENQHQSQATIYLKKFEGRLIYDLNDGIVHFDVESLATNNYRNPNLELYALNDLAAEPITLGWDEVKNGWSLYENAQFNKSIIYFAIVDCERPDLLRPCVISSQQPVDFKDLSPICSAMLQPTREDRQTAIEDCITIIEETRDFQALQEFASALSRFQRVHPHGSDLIKTLLSSPMLMALLWLDSLVDGEQQRYLQKICDTSPFDWWMIPIPVWLEALGIWRSTRLDVIDNVEFKEIIRNEARTHILSLSERNLELTTMSEVLLHSLDLEPEHGSAIHTAEKFGQNGAWNMIQMMILGAPQFGLRSLLADIDPDVTWPALQELDQMRDQLPSWVSDSVIWPAANLAQYKRRVMQAPIVAAAILHACIPFTQEQKTELLLSKNFYPEAFEELLSAAQAALWVHTPGEECEDN